MIRYIVRINASGAKNLNEIASELHSYTDFDLAMAKQYLAAGTIFKVSFDNKGIATRFADKYRGLNCNVEVVEQVDKKRCSYCDELIAETESFCPFCAEPVDSSRLVPIQPLSPLGSDAKSVLDTGGIKPITSGLPGSDERLKIKMSRLNDLLSEGFITPQEYDNKKQQLINEYLDI